LRLICKGITVESKPLRFADGKYHHLAVTCDDGQIAFYLDGAPAGSGRVPAGEPISMTRNLFVGEDADHGREEQLRGSVDDILVLGQALSALEIKTISQKGAEAVLQSRDRTSKGRR
jgi:sialidase-1